jgi:hypothetical protein
MEVLGKLLFITAYWSRYQLGMTFEMQPVFKLD